MSVLLTPGAARSADRGQTPEDAVGDVPVKQMTPQAGKVTPGHLNEALKTAKPGQMLILSAGVHPGPMIVRTPVQLVGEPGAVIEGSGQGSVVILEHGDISLSNLEVRGSGADLAADDAVILLKEAEHVTIKNCRILARAFGIYLRAGGHHRILENEVIGDASLASARRGNGIHLWKTVENEIIGNRLSDVRDGVYLSFAHENEIRNNRGTDLRYGIHYMFSERNQLIENQFSGCTGGIALMFSLGNRIEANNAWANRDFGILCQQLERSVLTGNRVWANGRGFFLENSADNRFTDNQIEQNGVGAYLTAGSERNVFTSNHFEQNLVQVYSQRSRDNQWSEDGRGNFWSDYAGFDWDRDGVGETPYRLQTAASALMARRPFVRWFWMSPFLALLDWWDGQLKIVRSDSFDRHPMIEKPGDTDRSLDRISNGPASRIIPQ